MQDKTNSATAPDPIVAANSMAGKATQSDFVRKIVEKIKNSENILIALSRDPSVDEIAAAIGLTVYLDNMQKHATAIYSGRTPKSLAFLQPDATFERNTDSLQDFIISLSKEKADHLRYKLEGDFVKIFITPYKVKLSEDDLSFSYGDYNVDFVIAINVASAGNLDEALREHGRIMHDASVVNITTGDPGRFGEIEWSNPTASSLCEMVTELIFAIQGNDELPLDRDVATALLTGIVAATDRFSNERTNPDTMGVASKLMSMGADQQLITSNVKGNEIVHNDEPGIIEEVAKAPRDKTNLSVDHDAEPEKKVSGGDSVAGLGALGNGAVNMMTPGVNPAVQAAPSVSAGSSQTPPTAVTATNNVAPESVVVQPVIPGAANGGTTPVAGSSTNGAAVSVADSSANGVATPVIGSANAASTSAPADPSVMTLPGLNAAPAPANNTPAIEQMQIPSAPAPAANTASTSVTPSMTSAPSAPASTVSATPVSVAQNVVPSTPAPGENTSRPMATSAPAEPTTRQVGSTLQPPAPKPKKTKNYAEMMEEALAEPVGMNAVNNMQPVNAAAPEVSANLANPAMMSLPNVPVASAAAPAISTPVVSSAPAMEPVTNPMGGAVLPPPPAPTTGIDMMPPVLPQVQMQP